MQNLLCWVVLMFVVSLTATAQSDYGFTYKQLQSGFLQSGLAKQRLYSVQSFGSEGAATPAYVAVLSGTREGWQVSVLRRVQNGFRLEWNSHSLPPEFGVSSPWQLKVLTLGEEREPVVMFSGCAQHLCGGTSGVGGFVLYSTLRKRAFFVRYNGIDSQNYSDVAINFSEGTLKPENRVYKKKLQEAVDALPY